MTQKLEHLRQLDSSSIGDLIKEAVDIPFSAFVDKMNDKGQQHYLMPTQNSDKCNQKCSHCFMTERHKSEEGRPLSDEQLTELMESYKAQGYQTYMYFQEPVLRADYFEKIEQFPQEISAINPAFFILKPDLLERVLASGIKEIKHSIHGPEKEHLELTKSSSRLYHLMLEGIELIVAAGLRMGIETTYYQGNRWVVSETASLLREKGVHDWYVGRAIPVGAAMDWDPSLFLRGNDARQVAEDIAEEVRKSEETSGMEIRFESNWGPNFFSRWHYRYLLGQIEGEPVKSTYWCDAIDTHMLYTSTETGRVYPCFYHLDFQDETIGQYNQDTGQLDMDERAVERWTAESVSENLSGICAQDSCEFHKVCLGGCRATASAFARIDGHEDPFNAGMDFCLTHELSQLGNRGNNGR